jgi:hypothetical protein
VRHESSGEDHQHSKADQYRCQADAEGDDQEEAKADAMQRDSAQENDERSRARYDSAGDPEGEKLCDRNRLRRWRSHNGVVTLIFCLSTLEEGPNDRAIRQEGVNAQWLCR